MRTYLMIALFLVACTETRVADGDRIRPWSENPSYWQYKGEPILLLGGSDDDNLFQWEDEPLRAQLETLVAVGGNYVRNTMSDRPDKGYEVYPYATLPDGRFDLNEWNPEYWRRFERFLDWTAERDIIVQIEVWDRFDQSRDPWLVHPFNPNNNVNFTFEESGFAPEYPNHPGRNEQPFFFTTPDQQNNELVLGQQQRFVDKMLSYALAHGNVLYCMDNETSGEEAWGRYWAGYIKRKAEEAGVTAYVTEMWDEWNIQNEEHRRTFDHPELYDFVDVSQNNHNRGDEHWENAVWVRDYIRQPSRPVNTVKTYGADSGQFGSDQDGVERFWRHLLAGFAAARFHRPDSGLGLNAKAQASIRAARMVESIAPFWELRPVMTDSLSNRESNETYAAVRRGRDHVLYFPSDGSVELDVGDGEYVLRWINIGTGEWGRESEFVATDTVQIDAPSDGHWVAVISLRP